MTAWQSSNGRSIRGAMGDSCKEKKPLGDTIRLTIVA